MARTATIALVTLLAAGCAAPWQVARGSLSAARTAVDTIEREGESWDVDREELARGIDITREAMELGDLAIDIWERERTQETPTGWQKWIGDALEGVGTIMEIVKAAGVNIPPAVSLGLAALQGLLPALIGGT